MLKGTALFGGVKVRARSPCCLCALPATLESGFAHALGNLDFFHVVLAELTGLLFLATAAALGLPQQQQGVSQASRQHHASTAGSI